MDTNNYDMPMKWHKFLIYFSLWAGAVLCVVSAIKLLTGSIYGDANTAEQVYRYYTGMKTVDSVFGVVYLGVAALLIYVRFQLAGFKEGAPNKLTIAYVVELAAYLGYFFTLSSTVKMPLSQVMDTQAITSISTSVVMIIANRVYYNKRAHYFGADGAPAASSYVAPTAPAERYCPNCGAKVEPDDAFCVGCGTKLK